MICPPKKSKSWKNFINRVGNADIAHTIFFLKDGDIEDITDEEIASYLTPQDVTPTISYKPIKPGVEELFESNSELANTVYEALGFKTNITQNDKSYYRGQIEQPIIDKDGNLVLYGREDELYKRAGLSSKGISMTDDLQSAIDYGNGQLEVAQNLASETYDSEKELEKLSENGYYLIQIPKKISNEIVKEAGEVKVIGDKIIIPKGQYKVEQVIDGTDTQITPQQKQQAQQLYSSYLDTIFPDSKVKDIVYRGKTENQTNQKSKELGIFFTDDVNAANIYAVKYKGDEFDDSIIQGIVNKFGLNPTVEQIKTEIAFFKDMGATEEQIEKDAKEFQEYILNNKGITEQVIINIKNPKNLTVKDWFDNYDNSSSLKENSDGLLLKGGKQLDNRIYDAGENQIVVFEPEQIHILGSKQDIEGFKEFVSTPQNIPSFKPISLTTLSPLKQIDFRESLKVGNKLTFNYWDEGAQTERSEEDFLVEKIDRNNFTGTSVNGTNTINYSDVVDTSIDKTLTFKDRRIFFDNLSVGKFVKINTVYGPIEGAVSNFDSESFTVGENIIKYSEIYKSNEIIDFEMKLQELRRTLNNQLLVTKNIKTAEQKRRVDSLRDALDNLNRYGGDLEDLHGLFVTMKENFDRVKATIKNISDPAKQMTPEKLLYTISYAKNYIDSFTGLRSINTSIQNFEGSTELKAASNSLVATLTNVQDEYFEIVIPKLAEVLWKQFNPSINKDLLKLEKTPWTLERLIQELRNPTRDIDALNTYFVAPTNANDIIVALFTKTLKAAREASRALDEKLLRNITPLIDRVKSKMDINEAMKSFYTEVDMQVIEDGEEKTIRVRKFIDKHNVDSWYSTTNLIYQERQLLYDQLAVAKLNNNIAESQKLSALIRGLNRRLQMFREAKGIQITGEKFKIEMERYKEFDEPKFWKFLDSYYKRVELDKTNSSTVSVVNEETGETEYYNYSGNRWVPNMDLYLTKEYEALEKGDKNVFNLYKFVKDEYDKANYKIPMSYRLNNVVPSMYEKNFLDSIQKSAQNFFEDNNKQYLVRMDGRAYKEIPIGFTKIMDISKSDNNILRSTLMFITEANNYATMNEQYGSVDAITQVLANNNPLDETQKKRMISDINNRKEAIKKIIKQTYYGEKNTTHGMAGKTIDALSKFTALTRLALKPLNWASNFLRGNFENMSEAIGGRHYTFDDLKWANKEFMKLQARNPKKLANMIRSLDAVQGRFMKSFGDEFLSFKEKYASTEVLFLGQDLGEVQIQGTAMLALLKARNIQIPEDGNFDMDNLPEYFIDTLHAINKHNHGVYNDFDRLYAQDNALFRLFLQFRKYIIPTFRARYSGIFSGEYRIDYEAGTVERGYYREFGEYIHNSFKNFESLPNMIASFKTLNPVQQEGVKRTMVDLVGFFGFIVMSSLFKPGDDEEDEDSVVSNIRWHIAYQFARLKGDLGTYIPIFGTKDQLRIINNPFAAVPVISDIFSLFSALGDISPDKNGNWWLAKEYLRNTATRQKGELKIFGTLSKLNPLDNVLDTFFPKEMYDKFDKASQR